MADPRCLLGPVDAGFEASYLAPLRARGTVRTFGHPGADVPAASGEPWAAVADRFPDGWAPDFVALWLPYAAVPGFVWQAPVPVVGLAADWSLNWHAYRHLLPLCDLVLTDGPGCAALRADGLRTPVAPAVLYGLGREWLDGPAADGARDVDVAFVGNLSPAVQGDRLPWVAGLAALHPRFRVAVATGVFGADYRRLLRRTKVAFNRSARGECNQRALEAAAAGAVLFQEAGNAETFAHLAPGAECVAYSTPADLRDKLEHYLTRDADRAAVAAAARAKVAGFAWDALWDRAVAEHVAPLVAGWAGRDRGAPSLPARVWARAGHAGPGEPGLDAALAAAGDLRALGSLAPGAAGVPLLARAAAADPGDPALALLLAEALVAAGDGGAAAGHARRGLAALAAADPGAPPPPWLDHPPCGPGFARLRAEWERAGALHAGDPAAEAAAKVAALRWRLHAVLAALTGDLADYHGAALARPDLPEARAALGCALARTGRLADAVGHLRAALAGNPFDAAAARALYQALSDLGAGAAVRALAKARRALHAAAPGAVPWDAWFDGPPPDGPELASVVVPCHGQLAYTKLCVAAVLAHTRPPYELVLVDDASPDGTPGYLASLAGAAGPERVVVVTSAENRGFAASVNRGLAAARGDLVVLLNTDAVVTPGWLDGLAAHAAADWPRVGLVGPVSNGAPAPQFVEPGYGEDLAGLDAFADRHRAARRGECAPFPRATGFCLLVRRAVLDRVGALDEGYGAGFFEDDDLCVRARRAGYEVRVARDVYVHHFGGRTFRAKGVDTAALLAENFDRFRAKWGAAEAAPYRPADLPGPTPAAARPGPDPAPGPRAGPPGGRARVSLTMIVRDEEHNLGACLAGFAPLVDEVVVVDTGSADRTRDVARAHGAKVFEFPWVDDFAAARNAALGHATGDYAFWADADDRVDGDNARALRDLFAGLSAADPRAWVVKCRCPGGRPGAAATVVDHVRVFPLRPDVRWTYRVHEQVLPALRAAGVPVDWSAATVEHVGYVDPAVRRRKLARDTRLLERELADRPGDPFALFNLGSVYHELGDVARAEPLLAESLRRSHPADSIVRKLYALVAQCRWRAGRPGDALGAVAEGRGHYPDDAELLYLEGTFRDAAGDAAGAEAALRRLVGGAEGAHFASVDGSLRAVRGRARLGWVLHRKGDAAGAAAEWRAAAAADPHHAPAWEGLGEVALAAGAWADAEAAAAACAPADPAAAAVLRARALAGRGDPGAARAVLEAAAAADPGDVRPREALSHVLLKSGAAPAAAEAALRDVLRLDPGHAGARHNLAVLLGARDGGAADPGAAP
jgi:GT2 family glycosyltransferase/thioredoxin-like negative regulator of GroEL